VSYLDNYYFNKPKSMPEVDAASFETIGDWFAKDRDHVYFLHRVVVARTQRRVNSSTAPRRVSVIFRKSKFS
jgi:hypothetical protein